jgi:hypothetical protein
MNEALGLIRHVLTFGGGLLVAKGYTDDAMVQEIIGGVMTLAGAGWSVGAKRGWWSA